MRYSDRVNGARLLRTLRAISGLAQNKLAEALHVSQKTVSSIENAQETTMNPTYATRLARTLQADEEMVAALWLGAEHLESLTPDARARVAEELMKYYIFCSRLGHLDVTNGRGPKKQEEIE